VSDSNPRALLERTSLIVYDADIFNCSRHENRATIVVNLVISYTVEVLFGCGLISS
jgi:hypothetical protein